MARVQFGGIVTGLRGKVGGSVFSNNGSGPTYGTKTTATKAGPKKSLQSSYIANASTAWRNLSAGNRSAYDAYASTQPRTDSLGRTYYLTGFQMWCGLNAGLRAIGQPALTTFVDPTLVVNQLNPLGFNFLEFSLTNDIVVDVTPGSLNVNTFVNVFASRSVSAGKKTVSGAYKLLKSFPDSTVTPQISLAEYVALYGAVALGNTIFFKIVSVNTLSGIQSTIVNDYKVEVIA